MVLIFFDFSTILFKNILEVFMIEINNICIDEKIKGGKPVIKGTRVPVDLILGKLSGGMTYEELMEEYEITKQDILSALEYASACIAEEEIRIVA
jgi:uncharacterized protein (DUF433 family)